MSRMPYGLCRSPHGERGLKFLTRFLPQSALKSLPPRGAWIEISGSKGHTSTSESLPPRGAWIEISSYVNVKKRACRSPHGERGLKCVWLAGIMAGNRRSPHGERGLKLMFKWIHLIHLVVAPPTGSVD